MKTIIAVVFIFATGRIRITPDNYWIFVVAGLVIAFGSTFAIAFSVWYFKHRWQVRLAANITNELGWSFIAKGKGRNQTDWFGGKHNELSVAMQTRTTSYRGTGNIGTAGRRVALYVLRVCLPVSGISGEGINLFRSAAYGIRSNDSSYINDHFDSFDKVFCYKDGADKVPEPVKDLLLNFTREYPGALLLKDRKKISKYHLPEALFAEDPMVIIYDTNLRDLNKDYLIKRLDDLADIVQKIEKTMNDSPT